jgi:cytochrome c553
MARASTTGMRFLRLISVATLACGAAQAARADATNGAGIAQKGLPNVPRCTVCHGEDGAGLTGIGPRLAGASKDYLVGQLTNFRSGTRKNPIMGSIAGDLTPAQVDDLADYYSTVSTPSHAESADPSVVAAGRKIAEQGVPSDGLPACDTCHGAGGIGVAPTFPYLAGQQAVYIKFQINAWKIGLRGDPVGLMKPVALKLTDDQTAAVAAYFASLPAPKQQGVK